MQEDYVTEAEAICMHVGAHKIYCYLPRRMRTKIPN